MIILELTIYFSALIVAGSVIYLAITIKKLKLLLTVNGFGGKLRTESSGVKHAVTIFKPETIQEENKRKKDSLWNELYNGLLKRKKL